MTGAHRVLARLEAEGVRVRLNAAGDGVRLEAEAPPSAELVRLARKHRAELLEALAPPRVPAPARPAFTGQQARAAQVDALALTPGHCGACARWEAHPAPLAHLGECSAGRRAHGWPDGDSAARVETHAAHACAAWNGQGFRARASGKRYGPRPVSL